jgi:hypothetical protein
MSHFDTCVAAELTAQAILERTKAMGMSREELHKRYDEAIDILASCPPELLAEFAAGSLVLPGTGGADAGGGFPEVEAARPPPKHRAGGSTSAASCAYLKQRYHERGLLAALLSDIAALCECCGSPAQPTRPRVACSCSSSFRLLCGVCDKKVHLFATHCERFAMLPVLSGGSSPVACLSSLGRNVFFTSDPLSDATEEIPLPLPFVQLLPNSISIRRRSLTKSMSLPVPI